MKRPIAIFSSGQKALLIIALALFSAVIVSSMYPAPQAHAAGAVGDGGTGTGGTGSGYSYLYKYGWYAFDTNGSGPAGGFRNGSSWASAQGQCRGIGANQIIGFVYHNSSGSQMIYSYRGENNPSNYKTGPGYMSVADARARYDQMGGGSPSYVWGTNVGWFCYSSEPPDYPPSGVFDLANCTGAYGWAFDPSRSDYSIAAHIQVDGDTKIWGTANSPRADVNAAFGISGNHGFSYDISKWVSGSGSHTVSVYTYNINSAGVQTNPSSPLLIGTKTVSGCIDYNLTPSIDITSSKVVEADSTITMQPKIDNSGPTDSGGTTQWKLTSFQVGPGSGVPQLDKTPKTIYNSDQANPCVFYAGSGVSGCGPATFTGSNSSASGTGLNVPIPYKLFDQRTATAGDFAAGTKICYALSVQPRSAGSAQWVYSNPVCVTIGKSPKVQIWGGDLGVGVVFAGSAVTSNVNSGVVAKKGATFGSWVEYGIFATGQITGTGSGSAYAGAGLINAGKCNTSYLSFTNSGSSTCSSSTNIGNYANSSSIPNVAASFPVTSSTPAIGSGDLSAQPQSGVFKASSAAISLSGSNIQKGKWIVINAPGATVTINGDIKYTGDQLSSVNDIPQVIIIANKIIINANVTRVDAWLIASGSSGIIETCNVNSSSYILTGADRLTANKCNLPLTVNGPVMAKQLWLRRTGGSGSGLSSGDPAEVFNLRPDAYMWASLRASGSNRVQTVYSTELPPRL